jgi:hypothetical protein
MVAVKIGNDEIPGRTLQAKTLLVKADPLALFDDGDRVVKAASQAIVRGGRIVIMDGKRLRRHSSNALMRQHAYNIASSR